MVVRMRVAHPTPSSVSRMLRLRCTMTPAELAANTLVLAATNPRLLMECRVKEHAAALRVGRKIRKSERRQREVAAGYRCLRPIAETEGSTEGRGVDTKDASGSESSTEAEFMTVWCF